ncbi:hypothetical protein ERJ75_000129900 [Trypanosoma vivax]|nr:hypothetical protein ERJ75_000129900 [Trypanosoma vivax]
MTALLRAAPLLVAVVCGSAALASQGTYEHAVCEMGNLHRRMTEAFAAVGTHTSELYRKTSELYTRAWYLSDLGAPKDKTRTAKELALDANGDAHKADELVNKSKKCLEDFAKEVKDGYYNTFYKFISTGFGDSFKECHGVQNYYKKDKDKILAEIGENMSKIEEVALEETGEWEAGKVNVTESYRTRGDYEKYKQLIEKFEVLVSNMKTNLTNASKRVKQAHDKMPGAEAAVKDALMSAVVKKVAECEGVKAQGSDDREAPEKTSGVCKALNEKLEVMQKSGGAGGPANANQPSDNVSRAEMVEEILKTAGGTDALTDLLKSSQSRSEVRNGGLAAVSLVLAIASQLSSW